MFARTLFAAAMAGALLTGPALACEGGLRSWDSTIRMWVCPKTPCHWAGFSCVADPTPAPATIAGAESFPAWDINQSALSQVQDMNELYQLDAQQNENMGGVKEWNSYSQEQVFNAYVAWETHCRDYASTHWTNYSEYVQLSSIQQTTDALHKGKPPSYCGLLINMNYLSDQKADEMRHLGEPNFETGTWKP